MATRSRPSSSAWLCSKPSSSWRPSPSAVSLSFSPSPGPAPTPAISSCSPTPGPSSAAAAPEPLSSAAWLPPHRRPTGGGAGLSVWRRLQDGHHANLRSSNQTAGTLTTHSHVMSCQGGFLHTCCCRGGRRKCHIPQLCILGDGVCVGAVVEMRPVTTCCFVQGIKLEAVRHFILGVLNLDTRGDTWGVRALMLARNLSLSVNEGYNRLFTWFTLPLICSAESLDSKLPGGKRSHVQSGLEMRTKCAPIR